jgi:hypothetical protein
MSSSASSPWRGEKEIELDADSIKTTITDEATRTNESWTYAARVTAGDTLLVKAQRSIVAAATHITTIIINNKGSSAMMTMIMMITKKVSDWDVKNII